MAAYPREIWPGHREPKYVRIVGIPPTSGGFVNLIYRRLALSLSGIIEHMSRTFTALALALFSSSALAQNFHRQHLVRGLCQKDGCYGQSRAAERPR